MTPGGSLCEAQSGEAIPTLVRRDLTKISKTPN
jgi:hypothetical protein